MIENILNFLNSSPRSKEDNFIYIGKDKIKKLDSYLCWGDYCSGISILEESPSIHSMDIHLAKQIISKNEQPVIFSCSTVQEVKCLYNFILSQKKKKVYLFDVLNQMDEYEFYGDRLTKISLSDYSEHELLNILSSFNDSDFLGEIYKKDYINFVLSIINITIYQKENEGLSTNLELIKNNGTLEQIKKYKSIVDYSKKRLFEQVYFELSENREKKEVFENYFSSVIEKIKIANIFPNKTNDEKEFKINSLMNNKDCPVFIFLTNDGKIPKLNAINKISYSYSDVINLLLNNVYLNYVKNWLSVNISKDNIKDSDISIKDKKTIAFIMRNPPLVSSFNYSIMFAQSRAIGGTIIFNFCKIPINNNNFNMILENSKNIFWGNFTGEVESYNNIHYYVNMGFGKFELKDKTETSIKVEDIKELSINQYLYCKMSHNNLKFNKNLLNLMI